MRDILIAADSTDAADYIWARKIPTDVLVLTTIEESPVFAPNFKLRRVFATARAKAPSSFAGRPVERLRAL